MVLWAYTGFYDRVEMKYAEERWWSEVWVGVTGEVGGVVAGKVWTLGMEVCRYGCGCVGLCEGVVIAGLKVRVRVRSRVV